MAKTTCPECGCRLVVQVRLVKRDWEKERQGNPRFDHDEAEQLYASGLTVIELASRYGVSAQAVTQILNRRGIAMRGRKGYVP